MLVKTPLMRAKNRFNFWGKLSVIHAYKQVQWNLTYRTLLKINKDTRTVSEYTFVYKSTSENKDISIYNEDTFSWPSGVHNRERFIIHCTHLVLQHHGKLQGQ